MTRLVVCLTTVLLSIACSGSEADTPTNPGPTSPRAIRLEANLDFGDVEVRTMSDPRVLRIYNEGTDVLTVTRISVPTGYSVSWISGTIAAGVSQAVTVRFSPPTEDTHNGALTVNANHTSGTDSMPVSGRGVFRGPRTQFGDGQYRVGPEIIPGRYFTSPSAGCYWERQRGLGGTTADVIAGEFVGFAAGQWIVDILTTDRGFKTIDCGTWFNGMPRPRNPGPIQAGIWLVGSQLQWGTYKATALPGCYWERLRHFQGPMSGIIENDFMPGGGAAAVTLRLGDSGFGTSPECGDWTREAALTESAAPVEGDSSSIERNWQARRQYNGALR